MTDQGLGNDHSLNAAMSKTSDTMKSIHDEFARVSVIAGSDLRKRKIKEMKNDGPKKEPYATDEEVARARVLCAQLRAASHSFVEAYHELAGLRDTWGLRQAKRSASKVRPRRHCRHCAGRRALCGCENECSRSDGGMQCFLHCRHCVGDSEQCTCTQNCPATSQRAKCTKPELSPTTAGSA